MAKSWAKKGYEMTNKNPDITNVIKNQRVTADQVAEAAGVSQSAVSRVYTPGASVSQKIKDKVKKAAKELGYRPNMLARSLITGQSRLIGLVVAHLENLFYADVIEKLSHALQSHGYHLLIFMAMNDKDSTLKVVDELLDYQVDGIITASLSLSSDLTDRCHTENIPVVMLNRLQDDDRLSGVSSDNFVGGRKVAEFFVKGNHKRIAHISGWTGSSTQRDREAGFILGLQESGQKLFAQAVGNYDRETAKQATIELFANKTETSRPDAVFVANDFMAFAVMDTLRYELGLRVPEDVSVVGYDDVAVASWESYSLTTVSQPAQRMADEVVSTLLEKIANPDSPPRRISIDGPLIVRNSAKKP